MPQLGYCHSGIGCHILMDHPYLNLNSFEKKKKKKKGRWGGPSECDNQYHNDNTPVVALSTGWYSNGDRCHEHIRINGNRRSVVAMVVDECDSTEGCDADHDYQAAVFFIFLSFMSRHTYLLITISLKRDECKI